MSQTQSHNPPEHPYNANKHPYPLPQPHPHTSLIEPNMRTPPFDRPVLPSMAIARATTGRHRRRRGRLPDFHTHVVACGGKSAGVRGVPCYGVDAAAGVGIEGFDKEAVGAPYVYA
jgi:hypothetical protein